MQHVYEDELVSAGGRLIPPDFIIWSGEATRYYMGRGTYARLSLSWFMLESVYIDVLVELAAS